jgi:hypothetical protein
MSTGSKPSRSMLVAPKRTWSARPFRYVEQGIYRVPCRADRYLHRTSRHRQTCTGMRTGDGETTPASSSIRPVEPSLVWDVKVTAASRGSPCAAHWIAPGDGAAVPRRRWRSTVCPAGLLWCGEPTRCIVNVWMDIRRGRLRYVWLCMRIFLYMTSPLSSNTTISSSNENNNTARQMSAIRAREHTRELLPPFFYCYH